MPDMKLVQGFTRKVAPDYDFDDLWDEIRAVRTAQEEIMAFRLAGTGAALGPAFPYLASLPEFHKITPLECKRLIFIRRFNLFCPHCHVALPVGQSSRLRDAGVGRALNCCGRILLCEEI